jgi:poly-gamma-glutamate synthesis protein (capsule biosynthesis protein)
MYGVRHLRRDARRRPAWLAAVLLCCALIIPATTPTEASPEDEGVLITISAAGDVTHGGDRRKRRDLFAAELARQGGDYAFPFRNVYDIFSGDDLTIVNYEGVLTRSAPATDNTYSFAGPPENATALVLGSVEAVALDNNHVFDHGERGYADMQQALSEAGVLYSGNGESAALTAQGVKIGMLSYRTFDGRYPKISEALPGDIRALREQGCALVIVSYHWGEERVYTPNSRQIALGRATVDAGADLVLGHHSHVINPIELYNGKYICYSLANFSFAGNANPPDKDTFIFQQRFRVTDSGVQDAGMRVIPCRVSSVPKRNDFIPTPYDSEDAERVAVKLVKLGKGLAYALKAYPLDWPEDAGTNTFGYAL